MDGEGGVVAVYRGWRTLGEVVGGAFVESGTGCCGRCCCGWGGRGGRGWGERPAVVGEGALQSELQKCAVEADGVCSQHADEIAKEEVVPLDSRICLSYPNVRRVQDCQVFDRRIRFESRQLG